MFVVLQCDVTQSGHHSLTFLTWYFKVGDMETWSMFGFLVMVSQECSEAACLSATVPTVTIVNPVNYTAFGVVSMRKETFQKRQCMSEDGIRINK